MGKKTAGQIRLFARTYLKTLDPEAAARAAGLEDGAGLLEQEAVRKEILDQKQRLFSVLAREDVARRAAELAFGRCNDCVKLALDQQADVDELDLSLLSEIRRSEKGAVEIKLADRLKALECLSKTLEQEPVQPEADGVLEFLRELNREAGE